MERRHLRFICCFAILLGAASPVGAWQGPLPLPTNLQNFYMRGTQPNMLAPGNDIITADAQCASCHTNDEPPSIYRSWSGSLMAQAARDPLFYACLDIAEADAPRSGDICIRCHVPKAWLEGRSLPTTGGNITRDDRDGITCSFCHRMVDPFDMTGQAPPPDAEILMNLGPDVPLQSMDRGNPPSPGNGGGGSYVVDPYDRRRGPFPIYDGSVPAPPAVFCDDFHFGMTFGQCEDEFGNPTGCPSFESPFHRASEMCATCHDVSLPHFQYNARGTAFVFNGQGVEHPTGNKYDMVPVERTYSEWLKSDFAVGQGVDMGSRYGCNQTYISECQHCHQRPVNLNGCYASGPRPNLPHHGFLGASGWVLEAIARHWGPNGPLPGHPPPYDPMIGPEIDWMTEAALLAQKEENTRKILACAADLQVSLDDQPSPGIDQLKVRVINQTGHKLPTGYPEGRRLWLHVEFFDCTSYETPILEYGHYDTSTAELDEGSTKVYEVKLGLDDDLAAMLNRPAGPSSHFVLSNKVFRDNRIPPRGFTNAKFAAIQASPVDYSYADGQYWDDTYFKIPAYAVACRVTLYYQATTKEYIEFLRDNNPNPGNPYNRGRLAYDLWEAFGKSAPVKMAVFPPPPLPDCQQNPDPPWPCGNPDEADAFFHVELNGDLNGDRQVTAADVPEFVQILLAGTSTDPRKLCAADTDNSGVVNGLDVRGFVEAMLAS